jgi:hypothetical protein
MHQAKALDSARKVFVHYTLRPWGGGGGVVVR